MLTHLIHFTMLDAFSAVVIWGLYTVISSHASSDDDKDEVESTTVEQDNDEYDEEELFKPYHQTVYLDHGMTLLDWQRACEQAERDYMHLLDKRDFELYRDSAIYGDMYRDYESGQIFVYTKNGLVKMKGI